MLLQNLHFISRSVVVVMIYSDVKSASDLKRFLNYTGLSACPCWSLNKIFPPQCIPRCIIKLSRHFGKKCSSHNTLYEYCKPCCTNIFWQTRTLSILHLEK